MILIFTRRRLISRLSHFGTLSGIFFLFVCVPFCCRCYSCFFNFYFLVKCFQCLINYNFNFVSEYTGPLGWFMFVKYAYLLHILCMYVQMYDHKSFQLRADVSISVIVCVYVCLRVFELGCLCMWTPDFPSWAANNSFNSGPQWWQSPYHTHTHTKAYVSFLFLSFKQIKLFSRPENSCKCQTDATIHTNPKTSFTIKAIAFEMVNKI